MRGHKFKVQSSVFDAWGLMWFPVSRGNWALRTVRKTLALTPAPLPLN